MSATPGTRRPRVSWLAARVAVALAVTATLASPALAGAPAFQREALDEGVWLYRPAGDSGAPPTNSLVVEQRLGLVVVDAQTDARRARGLLAALKKDFDGAPVRYLVLSHPHAEAAGGAAAFPESTIVAATDGCRQALADPDFAFGAELLAAAGSAYVPPERRIPSLVVHARTDLEDDRNPIRLIPAQHAHSPGDMLVHLPDSNLLHAGGALFPDGNPYAGSARVGGWIGLLNQLSRQSPQTMVGVRGDAVRIADVRRMRDAFAWLRGQVEHGFIEQATQEQIAERVLQHVDLAERFDPSASPSHLPGLVQQAIAEAVQHRVKRGVPLPGEGDTGPSDDPADR